MGKTVDIKGKRFKLIVIVLLAVFLVALLLTLLNLWEKQNGSFFGPDAAKEAFTYNGVDYTLKNNVETFLVIGLDKTGEEIEVDSYNNDLRADFLMLIVFDNDAKEFSAVQINRDTMAEVNILGVAGSRIDTVVKQIALSHTYGNGRDVSCRNTADSVSSLLLGVKINHYASLSMDAVTILNDLVGGVEVTVLDDFTGIDDTLPLGETVVLRGEHALNYIRARQGLDDSTNIKRMERQRQYLNALYKTAQQRIEEDDGFIVDASIKISDYIISDRSVTQLQSLAQKMNDYKFNGIKTIEGESKAGEQFMEFYPDEEYIKQLVVDLFYDPEE